MVRDTGDGLRAITQVNLSSKPQTYSDTVGGNNSRDEYRFRLNQRSSLNLNFRGQQAGLGVQLLNGQKQVLQSSNSGSRSKPLRRQLAAGTYYVRVLANQSQSRYRLSLAATPTGTSSFPKLTLTPQTSGFNQPTYITNAADGSNRLFVVEQTGQIRIAKNGKVRAKPFLDIRDRVKSGGEQGLLSMAFPPNYSSKKHFYVYYTNQVGNLVIARYGLGTNPNQADPNSEQIILTIDHPVNTNHNGGQLAFGSDGYLYIGTGDGGGGGDPANNAQNPNSLLGKILRLDVESPGVTTYAIPSSNPFLAKADPQNRYRDEIWALGLRNPWRFSFDRQTKDLYIGDVGQSAYEEVNFQPAASSGGQNYGWNILEGTRPFNTFGTNPTGLVPPVAGYTHAQGESITGGFVYRGTAEPKLQGLYLYADFVNGKLWGLKHNDSSWKTKRLLDSPYSISTFGEDEKGNLYVADYAGGTVYKINA